MSVTVLAMMTAVTGKLERNPWFGRIIEGLVITAVAAFAGSTYALHKASFTDSARITALETQFITHIHRQAEDRRDVLNAIQAVQASQQGIIASVSTIEERTRGPQGVQGVQGKTGREGKQGVQGIQGQRGK